ncbi:hypothetical protein IJ118_02575 [Candidatus Saccharibacteria bacterium]|nr:hypothetical protein [Candidatus Saccharibacteria bacterium]
MKITILGAGAFGTALGGVLAEKGYDIDYYDSQIQRRSLSEALSGAQTMILCVPSAAVPHLLPYLPKDKPMVVATKGILGKQAFSEFRDVMVLSGPGFADDIKARRETYLTATDERVVELFTTDYLNFDKTGDVQGVLLCGALKNVYAILAGWYGLTRGSVEWERYITEAAEEMQALISANGGEAATVDLACGIGDLKLTCGLPSRNYEYGQMLRSQQNTEPQKTVEGLTTLRKILKGDLAVPESAVHLRELMDLSKNWG